MAGCVPRWRDRVAPLFPGYLFLQVESGQTIGPIRSTVGVTGIVRFGGEFAVVPDQVIEHLRMRTDPVTGMFRVNPVATLAPGEEIRIIAGPFDGLEGMLQRESGAERVIVLLKFLDQDVSVRVRADFVVPRLSAAVAIGDR